MLMELKSKKKYLKNRSIKVLRKRKNRKRKKYIISENFARILLKKNPTFVRVTAPQKLTLQYEDVVEVLNFIELIKKLAKKGYFIDLNLQNVTEIGEGAIAMLLSVLSDLERREIFFKGSKPLVEDANNILEKSGFFEHLKGSISKKNSISKNKILKTGIETTNQDILIPQIHSAMNTVWGKDSRCPPLYGGISEMMRNSCDHAFLNKKSIIWHLGISHFENDNCCKFSFVDNGVGIIKTYNQKGLIAKISNYFQGDADILYNAFKNGIESRTGLKWRGKGLPTIFEMYEDNIINNLVVITNNIYLDYDRKIFKKLPVGFSGTYYFWQINQTCHPPFTLL